MFPRRNRRRHVRRPAPKPEPAYTVTWYFPSSKSLEAHAYRDGFDWMRSRGQAVRWTVMVHTAAEDDPRCPDCVAIVEAELAAVAAQEGAA
jgi:hypothetical protein